MKRRQTWPWTRPDPSRSERDRLEGELSETRTRIGQARAGFNAVTDPDLVEFYIYELLALQARYSYLLRARKALEDPAGGTAPLPSAAEAPAGTRVLPLRSARPVA